jgi:glycosyltransferase involved in cell wall biosynthesis
VRLSAIVITKDEAAKIGACLDSLAFCDERIVVDGGSTDETVDIARANGARVEHHDWAGFGPQKNYALSLATGEWVLSIDADETVSPALAAEIERAIATPAADAYEFPRLSMFCGRAMYHSAWYPDYVLRLFRRGTARFTDDSVHERVVPQGPVARLTAHLDHTPVERIEQALARMDRYSTLAAEAMIKKGQRVWFLSGIFHGYWAFIRLYFLRLGFLDGKQGFLLAVATAEGSYYKYMKAWLRSRKNG